VKIPSKVISYSESTISKFARTLKMLEDEEMTPLTLYSKMGTLVKNIDEFLEVLDGLYALNAIDYDQERGTIFYVKRNI
jgi:hypothetical protein